MGIPAVVASFEDRRKGYEGLDFAGLVKATSAERAPETGLDFSPTKVAYFAEAKKALQLTADEEAKFEKLGFVEVDHAQPYTMASLYYGVYTRDLPVLVTTDSILYAWHRSFDNALSNVEQYYLAPELRRLLEEAHRELGQALPSSKGAARESLRRADVYLTVALNLLGDAADANLGLGAPFSPTTVPTPKVRTHTDQDAQVRQILYWVRTRTMQKYPQPKTVLFGQPRYVDYTQFTPRGHYTESIELQRYFRAMMWMGRADTGILLEPPSGDSLQPKATTAYRDALALSAVMTAQGRGERLGAMRRLIDRMVGSGTAISPERLAGTGELPVVVTDEVLARELPRITKLDGQALIRSRTIYTSPHLKAPEEPLSHLFQTFSQRFTIDSFALSKMVFDSVRHDGRKVERYMPEARDVAAALGNDEALFELEESLEKDHYAANLLAAREVIDGYAPGDWAQSTYNQWLSALRTLDDVPEGEFAPQVMKSRAWQQKQLETQLSSWANLRHDTILYTQQSYTAGFLCEYPTGYVEPYPDLYGQVAEMAQPLAELFQEAAEMAGKNPNLRATAEELKRPEVQAARDEAENAKIVLEQVTKHFERFAQTATVLERLARKELAGVEFSEDELRFIKQTIDARGGGSGPPRYDGWYAKLIYGEKPLEFNPTISDVHTEPKSGKVLQVGIGAASYLLVAIDNGSDRMVYVGPKFSFYEFTQPARNRLTDDVWERMLSKGHAPRRPAWTSAYRAKPVERELGGNGHPPGALGSDPLGSNPYESHAGQRRPRSPLQAGRTKPPASAGKKPASPPKKFGDLPAVE